jgi:ribose 5-phosphate isomerase A
LIDMTPSPSDPAKLHAARLAADLVQPGMAVGLGTGSTAMLMIQRLGQRVSEEGLSFFGVPTSRETADLATKVGISLVDLDAVDTLDLDIDGADEVDNAYRMIKGRGGALLREKIVAAAARRRVFIVGENKHVERLGEKFPVPVEVRSFGLLHTNRALQALGATTKLRKTPGDHDLYTTDGGNRIIDCSFAQGITDPEGLDPKLKRIPGVLETGLFLGLCDALIVGRADRADLIEVGPR